ncbi:MAG: FG-GAP repeat protein [Deltaproteobacteria bacterium]|nr:FG-GAP repeat protein [Deltaproteobacteria bacterium]
MRNSLLASLIALLACLSMLPGCGCDGDDDGQTKDGAAGDAATPDGGVPQTPTVKFVPVLDGKQLTSTDDTSSVLDGIQYDVTVETQYVETGRAVVFTNSTNVDATGNPIPKTAPVGAVDPATKKATVVFEAMTFANGQNILSVSTSTKAGRAATAKATVTADDAVFCTFTAPKEGDAFTSEHDADGATPGFQYNVTMECHGVESDNDVALFVNDVKAGSSQKVVAGNVIFNSVTFAEGANELTAAAHNNAGKNATIIAVHATVNTGGCLVRILKPEDGAVYLENGVVPKVVLDLDPQTAGMQAEIEVETAYETWNSRCSENSEVTWTITPAAGSPVEKKSQVTKDAQTGRGGSKLQLTLDETAPMDGVQITVAARVDETVGTDLRSGTALEVHAKVDSVLPGAAITIPADQEYFNASRDFSPFPGFQIVIEGTTTGVVAKEKVVLLIDATNPSPQTVVLGANATDTWGTPNAGDFRFDGVTIDPGTHKLRIRVEDASGNYYETADTTVFIDLDIPTIQFMWPANDQALLASDDEDGNAANGLQTSKIALDTQHVEDGQAGELRISGSSPFAFTVMNNAAVFADQYVTLPEGSAILLDAVVRSKADVEATQVPDPMQVSVDIHAPTIAFAAPLDNDVVDSNAITVNLQMTGVENGQTVKLSRCDKDAQNCLDVDAAAANNRVTFADLPLITDAASQPNLLTANVSDKAGNPAPAATVHVTVDQSVPVLTFVAPTDQATLDANADKDANLANGLQYDVIVDATGVKVGGVAKLTITQNGKTGAAINSAPAVTSGNGVRLTWTGVSLPEGQFVLTATYTSDLGKTGSAQVTVTVDTGRYTINVTDPADGAYLSAAADKDGAKDGVQVDVTAETNAPDGSACLLTIKHGSDTSVAAATVSGGQVTFGSAGVTLVEGANDLQVHCGDAVKSGDSLTAVVTVDTVAPTLAFTSPTNGQVFNLASVSTSFDTGFFVDVTIAGGSGSAALEDGAAATLTVTFEGGATAAVNGTFINNGVSFKKVKIANEDNPANDHPSLTVTASDLAGNPAAPATVSLLVDRVAPVMTVTNPTKTTLGIAEDFDLFKADLQNEFRVIVAGGSVGQLVNLVITGDTTYSTTKTVSNAVSESLAFPVELKEGVSLVRIYTSDDAGNASDTGQVSYNVDISAPELRVFDKNSVELLNGQRYTWNKSLDTDAAAGFQGDFYVNTKGLKNASTVKLCSNDPSGGGAACDFGGGLFKAIAQGSVVGSPASGIVTLKTVNMSEGTYSLFAESKDDVGNKSQSGTFEITVDSVLPTIAGIVINSNNAGNDKAPDILLGISEDADSNIANGLHASVTVTATGVEDGQTLSLVDHGTTTIGTVTVSGNSAVFSLATSNLILLSDGTHSLTASVADKAGNSTSGSPIVPIVSDGTAPTLSFDVPDEYKSGAWLTQGECTAHPGYSCVFDGTNLKVTVTVPIGDNISLVGQKVMLSGGAAPSEYTITGGTGGTVTFTAYVLAQGANNLAASLSDVVGNTTNAAREVDVDTIAAAVAFVVPNNPDPGSPRVFEGTDDKDGDPQNGLQTDAFVVSVTGVTDNTTVEIQWRPKSGGTFTTVTNGTAAFSADNASFAFSGAPYPTLSKGEKELRLKATDAKGNITYSTSVYVTVNLNVPAVGIEKLGGDGTPNTADDLATGAKFLKTDATDTSGGVYKTTIVVVSDVLSGTNARLWINDVEQTSVPLSGGKASFVSMVLNQYTATNKLKAQVEDPTSHISTTEEITGVLADGDAPTVAFTYPTPGGNPAVPDKTYTAANDNDGNGGNGLQFKAGEEISIQTTGVENGQIATLTCNVGGAPLALTNNAVAVASNAAKFTALSLPTKHSMFDCTVAVSDFVGNPAADPTHIYLVVDVTPPGDTKYQGAYSPIACIGETTDSGEEEETEPAACAALCKTTKCSPADYDAANCTCSRRRGHVTLAWTAPADDAEDATSGKVKDYEVRWQMDTSVNHDCSGFDWNTASSTGVEKDTIVDPAQTQTARVRGLTIHNYYCLAVKSVDFVDNGSSTNFAYARERRTPFIVQSIATGGGGQFGSAMAVLNLDGNSYADIVVGAPAMSSNNGELRIYYGNSVRPDVTISGPTSGYFGQAVSYGDVNGDGFDDVLVGAPGTEGVAAGKVYVYYGSASGITTVAAADPLPSLQPDVVISNTTADTNFGRNIANRRCNYNNDVHATTGKPLEDIVVSTWWENVYVVKGSATLPGTMDLGAAAFSIPGPISSLGAFRSLACGDVDKDNFGDIVFGYDRVDATGFGEAAVVFGASGLSGSKNPDLVIAGDSQFFGMAVFAGDLSQDDASDLFIGDVAARVYQYLGVPGSKASVTPAGNVWDADVNSKFGQTLSATADYAATSSRFLVVGKKGGVVFFKSSTGGVANPYSAKVDGSGKYGLVTVGGFDVSGDGFEDIAVTNVDGNGNVSILR